MKTTAVRLYGKRDLRLESFTLPDIREDEILARVVSDSICMSSHKAAEQGAAHKRVPNDVAQNPVIIGHEFCGVIEQVGAKWRGDFRPGDRFAIQPAINYQGSLDSPGYSFAHIGGAATRIIIPQQVMTQGCLLPYQGEAFFHGSLAEPVSCIVGAFHAQYHTQRGSYRHEMGIRPDGCMAILAGAGPMGLGAIDYTLHTSPRPSLLVVTDIDAQRLARAAALFSPEAAARNGMKLVYLNTRQEADPIAALMALTGGKGYDDVYVYAPVAPIVEQGDAILGNDGCLNFFAGPVDPAFAAKFNFYNAHYASTHIVGTSGGNTQDLIECLDLMARGIINPSAMITHIGGLDAVIDTTLNLPSIPGGKKLIYTHIAMPLTALDELSQGQGWMRELGAIVAQAGGLWSPEAEAFLLANAPAIEQA